MSSKEEEKFETVRTNYMLLLTCDKYIFSVVKKSDLNIRNWMEVFLDITANLGYKYGKVSSNNINNDIVPNIKLIHVYLCDFIYKLLNNKYKKKEKYFKDISKIKRLIKIIKNDIESEDLDNLLEKIEIILNSKQIVAKLKNEYENILILLEKYITFYFNNFEKSEIYIKHKDFESTEGFINFLDNLTHKFIEANSNEEPNTNLLLVEKDKIHEQSLTQDKENFNENSEYKNNINKSSQKLIKRRDGDWNENEIYNLIKGIKKYGKSNWSKILKKYPFENRTEKSLISKYCRIINLYPNFHDKIYKLNKNNKSEFIKSLSRTRKNTWSENEINYLKEGIKEFGTGNWKKIVNKYPFQNRTFKGLSRKYIELSNINPNFFKDCEKEKNEK